MARPSGAPTAEGGLRRELGLSDLILAQVLCVVGSTCVGVAAKLGRTHVILWLAAMLLFYLPLAVIVIHLNWLLPLDVKRAACEVVFENLKKNLADTGSFIAGNRVLTPAKIGSTYPSVPLRETLDAWSKVMGRVDLIDSLKRSAEAEAKSTVDPCPQKTKDGRRTHTPSTMHFSNPNGG